MISLIGLLKEISLKEGGNVFKNSEYDAQNVVLNNIQPTVNKFVEDFGRLFPNKKASFAELTNKNNWLGSTGKKAESGDVDLAYSSDNFFVNGQPDIKGWGLNPDEFTPLYEKSKKASRSATDEQIQVKTLIQLIVKKINSSGGDLYASDKAANGGVIHFSYPQYTPSGEKLPARAQLDLDTGDLDWLKFRFNSDLPEDDPQIKGLHRGQLMLALFAATGYTFKSGKGFMRKGTGEIIASKPQEALEVFNQEYQPSQPLNLKIINDYAQLMNYVKTALKPEDRESTLNMFKEALRRADAYVPGNI